MATWTCTDDPCPWGDELSNPALAWPASTAPLTARLGYTVTPAVYLPADSANGLTITITFGNARVRAGAPDEESHFLIATLSAGESVLVSDVQPNEVLSVQSDSDFGYRVTPPDPAGTPDAGTIDAGTPDAGTPDAGTPDAGTTDAGTTDAGTTDAGTTDAGTTDAGATDAGAPDAGTTDAGTPPGDALASQTVTWTCLGTPCPSGDSVSTNALVWPATEGTVNTLLGYLVSAGIYLPGERANGADISIATGEARVYAGFPDEDSDRLLAIVAAGETFHVDGVAFDAVVSVQADSPFTYRIALPPSSDPGPGGPVEVIPSTQAFWRCNLPGCDFPDWTGAVINWPSWAAYQSNDRTGDQSRSVFSADGTPLYPYMGAWAQGCEVTAESGVVEVIEWERGTDVWRRTWLYPRQSHVINLVSPEDGAMFETYEGSPGFSVSLRNCTPQPLPQ